MKSNSVISSRGQITLPIELRKKYGLAEGSFVTIEERFGEIILKPAAVFEIELYSDEQISEWEKENGFDADVEARLRAKAQKRP